ncbi:MAG: DUF1266 domain-containing protein [Lachnospiraceae bacterium]|nr:DUF1266 domain-containing protein [Lachnospiraceae bacterium]
MSEEMNFSTYELDENGMVRDDDPVFEQLDEWHETDQYELILETIEKIRPEERSNKIRFRKISALNNLKRFREARDEIAALYPRCTTDKDKARIYYMLAYIYDVTDCEAKAAELYQIACITDPEYGRDNDLEAAIEKSKEYVQKDMDSARNMFSAMIPDLKSRFETTEKLPTKELEFFSLIGAAAIERVPVQLSGEVDTRKAAFTFPEEDAEKIRNYLVEYLGIHDMKSLMDYHADHMIWPRTQAALDYMEGQDNNQIKPDEMDISTRALWDLTISYLEAVKELLPKAGMSAWDYSEMVGLTKLMHGIGMITNTDLFETYVYAADRCREDFSSWEEFSVSLVLGSFYYNLTEISKYNIRESAKVASAFKNMTAAFFGNREWPAEEEQIRDDVPTVSEDGEEITEDLEPEPAFPYLGELEPETAEKIESQTRKAMERFGIPESKDGLEIATRVNKAVDEILESDTLPEGYDEMIDVAVALGCVFGHALCVGYGWSWKAVGKDKDHATYCVVSPEENYINPSMKYLYKILSGQNLGREGKNENTVLRLYQMLEQADEKPSERKRTLAV